jgi:hypothetical protein
MKTLRSIVVLVAAAGLLVGCGGGGSPQGTFEQMKTAGKTGGVGATLKYMTAESQDMMVGSMALGAVMAASMGKAFGKADADLEALLKKHGLDPEKAPKVKSAADSQKAIMQLGGMVKDKPGFLKDMEELGKKKGKKTPSMTSQLAGATLKDVKITGEKAEGKVVIKKGEKEDTQPIHFKKEGGKWLIDLMPMMKAASN